MNSFNFVARGIDAEVERQIGVWESGGEVSRRRPTSTPDGDAHPRRAKEERTTTAIPEPDLVPVEPPAELVERLAQVSELPQRGSGGSRRTWT